MNKSLLKKKDNNFGAKWRKEILTFLFLFGFLSFNTANAQLVATNYNYTESAGQAYTPITGGTVVASGVFLSVAVWPTINISTLPTPFIFYYNGAAIQTVSVSDNGFVILGGAIPVLPAIATTVSPISAGTLYTGAVASYGYNLVGLVGTAEVRYEVIGTAPNRVFVAQYKDVQRRSPLGVTYDGLMNMQIRLNETTNTIEVIYRDFPSSTSNVAVIGQDGLRGASNSDYNGRRNNVNPIWTNATGTSPTVANNQGLGTQGTLVTGVIQQGPLPGTQLVWTPCFAPTGITTTLLGDNSTINISWTNPGYLPSGGFDWEVNTTGVPGTGIFASGNTSSNSVSVPSLASGTTYYIFVKPNCKTTWTASTPASVSPVCPAATIPYTQNFEGSAVPVMPFCNTTLVVSGAAMVTVNNAIPFYGFTNKNVITQGALAQNTWYFTQAITITPADMVASGGSFRLSYKYGGSREQSFFEQKMKVFFGTAPTVVGMTTLLADHNSIKLSPINGVLNFTVAAAGTYYVGFNGYAIASQGYLQLDDINLDISSCKPPTALTSGQITSNSAVIAWTSPVISPSSGYQYYLSTVNTAPIGTTLPSGSTAVGNTLTTLTGLTGSTTYYFWVRSNCGSGETSIWSLSGTFTTLVPYVVSCVPSGFGFAQDSNGITNVTMGSINNTTGIEVNNYGDYSGFTTNVAQGATLPVNITYRTGFTYETAIWIDWNNDGDFVDVGEQVYTGTSLATNPTILAASFTVPALQPLGPYRVRIGGIDSALFAGGPLTPCRTGAYQAYEDYSIFVITPPPALTLFDGTVGSSSNTICSGDDTSGAPVTVTSVHNDFQVYNWTPSTGVNGTLAGGYYFNPTTTTTYILTASQTSGNFSSNSASYTVYVNPLPTTITITPSAVTTCQSATTGQALVASGGIVSGVDIMVEDFNGATNTFTTVNNSSPALVTTTNNPADAAWTLHNSPFLYGGNTFTSNDASQFYLSNSDDQGSSGLTNTLLISPVFSLAPPITNASLSFWHIYRGWSSGTAQVEISTNGGGSYTPLPTAAWTTANAGTTSNWVNVNLNLAAYLGNANCRIRFNYKDAFFGWFWGIDNVRVTGSSTSDITWSPTTGLWNDAALTSAYIGAATSTVYTRPNTTTTYIAGADDPFTGCHTETIVVVTVTPFTGGTASSNQTICFGAPTALSVAGYTTPSTLQWQSSVDNITFGNIPTATSSTLTAALMGALTATRYYRVLVTNGTCTAYSTVVTITLSRAIWNAGAWSNVVGPDATMIAQFNSAYTSSGDLSACSVVVTAGAVTFLSNHTLTVQNDVRVTGGSLIFNNNSSLVQVNTLNNLGATITNTGNITYRRDTTGMLLYDYTYWSSPVVGQTLNGMSPNTQADKFFTYDSSVPAWVNVLNSTVMSIGKGYIVRAPDNAPFNSSTRNVFTGIFTGVPNTGTYTTPIFGGSNQVNLIGNPYASAIYASDLMDDPLNVPIIDASFYLWTHNTVITSNNYTPNDYAIYNYMGGVGTSAAVPLGFNANIPNGKIASGQGFFVKGLAPGVVTFKNDMRVPAGVNNNNQFFRLDSTTPHETVEHVCHRLWLDVSNPQGGFKQTMIGYAENATNGIDRGYDSDLLDIGNAVTLYSFVDTNKLSIQGRPLPFENTDFVPLGFKSTVANTFTISLSNFDDLFTTQNVYLEDTLLNVLHDLKLSNYTFATEIGTFENRFIVRYLDSALGIDNPAFNENSVIVYKNGQGLQINSGAMNMKDVTIFDVSGRLLSTQNNIGQTTTSFTTLPTTQQVLLVKIIGENGAVVTKKVVY